MNGSGLERGGQPSERRADPLDEAQAIPWASPQRRMRSPRPRGDREVSLESKRRNSVEGSPVSEAEPISLSIIVGLGIESTAWRLNPERGEMCRRPRRRGLLRGAARVSEEAEGPREE